MFHTTLDLVQGWCQRRVGFPALVHSSFLFICRKIIVRSSCVLWPLLAQNLCSTTQGTQPFVGPLVSADIVSSSLELGIVSSLRFRDPKYFRSNTIHCHSLVWEHLLADFDNRNNVDLLEIIQHEVRIEHFFRHFKETFKQQSYDMASPAPIMFKNPPSWAKFSDFIADTIAQWVESGVVSIWGDVGSVPPPHLVLPLTVEPSKAPALSR